jgi:hypothetical protein
VGIFVLQVNLMDRLAPRDAHGDYFFSFIMIESGGGLLVGFCTLFRERAKSKKISSGTLSVGNQKR